MRLEKLVVIDGDALEGATIPGRWISEAIREGVERLDLGDHPLHLARVIIVVVIAQVRPGLEELCKQLRQVMAGLRSQATRDDDNSRFQRQLDALPPKDQQRSQQQAG